MKLVAQWSHIESVLPADWGRARLGLEVEDAAARGRAAALLGPVSPGRSGRELRFDAERHGGPGSPDGVRRLLGRLDGEGIAGTLALLSSTGADAVVPAAPASLANAWDGALAALPPDWSDLYCELELSSSDYLDRAALLAAPINPARDRARLAFHFRVARQFGYGVSPAMTRRCLARLDGDAIRGTVRVLRALSETHNVATQGPVWRVDGKAV